MESGTNKKDSRMFLLFLSQSAQAYLDFHLSNFQIFENFRHLAFFQHLYLNIFACIPFPRPSLPFLTSISTNKGASKYQDSFFAPLILMYIGKYQSFYAAWDMSLYTSTFSWWLQRIQRILTDNWEYIKSF